MGAFTGKTVLILGGSRGIGAAIVRRFVTDGANVRFTYAGSKDAAERLAQETGATAVFTDSADRDAVIDVVRKSGALDILVVNAGIGVFGDALELNADDIDRLFKINIHAPYHASVEAARQIVFDDMCLIINIKENSHDITAFCISYCSYATCVLYFSNITWMLKMIHYFLTVSHLYFLLLSCLFLFFHKVFI